MINNPFVSVVVACYNHGGYLDDCISSILRQTYKNFELIIVNDGSTDNTDEIVKKYLDNKNIIYIDQSNAGQAIATNNGILKANGELISFIDADDIWDYRKLEKQVPLFSRKSIGVVYSGVVFIDAKGIILEKKLSGEYYTPKKGCITKSLFFENFIPYSSTIVRRDCFDKVGMFNPEYINGLDWDMWLRISLNYEFDYIDKPLLRYRIGHPGQLISNVERSERCSDLILNRFILNNPGLFSSDIIDKALSYSYCKRGNMLRKINLNRSTNYFMQSLKKQPFQKNAYIGIIKNLLKYAKFMRG